MRLSLMRILVVCGCVALLGGRAAAQEGPFARATGSVMTPGVSLAAPDGAFASEVNPSALGFMPAWELAYVHMDAARDDPFVHGGDGVFFGAPLFLGLSLGAHIGSVRPTEATGLANRGVGSLSLAFAPTSTFSVGTSARFLQGDDFLGRHVGWDVSMSARPSPYLAVSMMAHDLNALVDLSPAGVDLPATFIIAAAVRPFGTDALTLEAAGAMDSTGATGARGMVGVGIPYVGQLRAVVEADDLRGQSDLRVLAGLDVRWGRLGFGGGAVWGNDFEGGPGWFVTARIGGAEQKGIPARPWVLDVEVRGKVDSRRILELTRVLDRARHDDAVAGVLLRLRGTDMGLAYAQEVRWLVTRLEQEGKRVVCQLESATGSEYYACAGASRVLGDPAGMIRLLGPKTEVVFLGDLLDRVGVRADFVRVGKYKSAPEQLTRSGSSEPAREQREALLDDAYLRMVTDLAGDRETSPDAIRRTIDRGPHATSEALSAALLDGEGDDLSPRALVGAALGDAYPVRSSFPTRVPERWGRRGRVGVVVVDGSIVDGENVDVPVINLHMTGAKTAAAAIDRMVQDPAVGAIVVRVDSGGGSAVGSDKLWRAVRRARSKKPVVASLGAAAASGGYYVASAADEIWADPTTVTGSIGIFFGKVDVSGLADRVGVNVEQLTRGERAGAQSIWRPYTEDERAVLQAKILLWYKLFLRRVAEGRGMEPKAVHALGQGRVWSGDAAVRNGLVDHLGGFGAALARARSLANLPDDAPFDVVPFRPRTLVEHVIGRRMDRSSASSDLPVPTRLREALEIAGAVGASGDAVPLAITPHRIRVE